MSKHILSLVGTSLYEPVVYYDDTFNSREQEFVQLAIVEKYKEAMVADKDSRITFFITEKAKVLNVLDREYNEREANDFAKKWVSDRKNQVICGANKKGMQKQFEEQFPELKDRVDWIPIADAQTEEQISEVFHTIYTQLREKDEIIFDITHSFRSIPMLALTVINYAKVLKACTLTQICYGAYEAATKEENCKRAPISNLTVYDEILEWTSAADAFMRFGNASMMKNLFTKKLNTAPISKRKEWSSLRKIMNEIENLSDTIQTGRGVDGELLSRKSTQEVSVKSAYERYEKALLTMKNQSNGDIAPLTPLLEKVKESFASFDCENNYDVGMAVVEWSIHNDMVQLGYTALEETIKTYLCQKYHLNEIDTVDRDDIIGRNLVGMAKAKKEYHIYTQSERMQYLWKTVLGNETLRNALAENPRKYQSIHQLFEDDNMAIAELLDAVKDARNDINHFGMRAEPRSAANLKEQLEDSYVRFCQIMCFDNSVMKKFRVVMAPDREQAEMIAAVATVEAEYGDFCIEGEKVTLAHHGTRSHNPAPCNTQNVPVLDGGVILVSHVDLDALGGILAVTGQKMQDDAFWAGAEIIDVNGTHHMHELSQDVQDKLNAYYAWREENESKDRKTEVTEVTYNVFQAKEALDIILNSAHPLHEAYLEKGRKWEKNATKAVETRLVHETSNVRCFVTDTVFCAAGYYSPKQKAIIPATVTMNTLRNSITLAFADGGKVFDAGAIAQSLWGKEAGGRRGIAGSPRNWNISKEALKEEFQRCMETVEKLYQ